MMTIGFSRESPKAVKAQVLAVVFAGDPLNFCNDIDRFRGRREQGNHRLASRLIARRAIRLQPKHA
jgi:hypothetical protein